jgi:hypothetical protein
VRWFNLDRTFRLGRLELFGELAPGRRGKAEDIARLASQSGQLVELLAHDRGAADVTEDQPRRRLLR